MTSLRARRAAAGFLLAAGALFLLPAAVHAEDSCAKDYKGEVACLPSGAGPTSGPGSYTGSNGVHDGKPGEIGPDGRPKAEATPPPWVSPDWSPPPVPDSAQPAPNPPGLRVAPPPAGSAKDAPRTGQVPLDELPAGATLGSAAEAAGITGNTATPSPAGSAREGNGNSGPAPTMTAMVQGAAPPDPAGTEPDAADAARASSAEPFSPVPLLATLGGVAAAGAAIRFIPGLRATFTGLLARRTH